VSHAHIYTPKRERELQLFRLAYGSAVSGQLSKDDLRQILAKSVQNNQAAGLTGALCFTRGYFFQILEGGRFPINQTFQKISRDERHRDIVLIGLAPIESRAFGRWSMAFIDDTPATTSIIFKHCGADRLVLDYLSMEDACALGRDLVSG
jgi:hypothetical protein